MIDHKARFLGHRWELTIQLALARHLTFDLISIKDAARVLGRSVRTLRRWEVAGKMPNRIKHGRRLKYRKADAEAITVVSRPKEQL